MKFCNLTRMDDNIHFEVGGNTDHARLSIRVAAPTGHSSKKTWFKYKTVFFDCMVWITFASSHDKLSIMLISRALIPPVQNQHLMASTSTLHPLLGGGELLIINMGEKRCKDLALSRVQYNLCCYWGLLAFCEHIMKPMLCHYFLSF